MPPAGSLKTICITTNPRQSVLRRYFGKQPPCNLHAGAS